MLHGLEEEQGGVGRLHQSIQAHVLLAPEKWIYGSLDLQVQEK